jgi:hypothetical protein
VKVRPQGIKCLAIENLTNPITVFNNFRCTTRAVDAAISTSIDLEHAFNTAAVIRAKKHSPDVPTHTNRIEDRKQEINANILCDLATADVRPPFQPNFWARLVMKRLCSKNESLTTEGSTEDI